MYDFLLKKDIISIESLQRKFTKKIPGTLGLSYHSKLKALNLESLELRRLRADLLLAYKILIVNQQSAISNDENGCRHMCLFVHIFINNFF